MTIVERPTSTFTPSVSTLEPESFTSTGQRPFFAYRDLGIAGATNGQFGFKVAQARPDKVKALIAVEPAGGGDPAKAALLKDIPTLVVYGDNIALDARWPQIRKNGVQFAGEISKAGGKVEVLDLPERGIRGNSHMLMMDRNNLQVAALIQEWLAKQGLVR